MQNRILEYVTKELLSNRPGMKVAAGDDLLGSGLVDSVGLMRLVAFIETERGAGIPATDLVLENFQSVEAIVAYLATHPGK